MNWKRLAIIGAGSSGLVTLKFAIEKLEGWEIVCFEKSSETTGAWGNPYKGFVSTSTKYTTQFACHREFDCSADPRGAELSQEFFRDGEYGRYLDRFVEKNDLSRHIVKNCAVQRLEKDTGGWKLSISGTAPDDDPVREEVFDHVIICTGLAEKPKPIDAPVEILRSIDEQRPPTGKRIVVIGGGESAVDIANRLAQPELHNSVYLSLKSGVRVSPRYHPIRGVPSDFLRNRYLLSIHENIRNAVGQKFVEARIKHQERFERFFGSGAKSTGASSQEVKDIKKFWAAKLTEKAKDNLFNMFHNKSDDFLDAVAEGRIEIIGEKTDGSYLTYADFEGDGAQQIAPDLVVPMIGYQSNLGEISNGKVRAGDFYLGCVHAEHQDLFLVGFARPIIGNIPTISEMQARYVTGLIAGTYPRPQDIGSRHAQDRKILEGRYAKLNTEAMYPVEMIPYCDRLARVMGTYPSLMKLKSLRQWLKISLSPASTLHYVNEDFDPGFIKRQEIHSPVLITVLLTLIKLFDLPYKILKGRGTR